MKDRIRWNFNRLTHGSLRPLKTSNSHTKTSIKSFFLHDIAYIWTSQKKQIGKILWIYITLSKVILHSRCLFLGTEWLLRLVTLLLLLHNALLFQEKTRFFHHCFLCTCTQRVGFPTENVIQCEARVNVLIASNSDESNNRINIQQIEHRTSLFQLNKF